MNLIGLHGFLGRVEDWDLWKAEDFGVRQFSPIPIEQFSERSLEAWASAFNTWVRKHIPAPRALIGYSLGGRLALHALLEDPSLFDKTILISSHPGLNCAEQRNNRFLSDKNWADHFLKLPWDELMTKWENQSVFKEGGFRFNRLEAHYDRTLLASQLIQFSLGTQKNLLDSLRALPAEICWITGKFDHFYSNLAKKALNEHPFSTHEILSDSFHRAPWDNPEGFSALIKELLAKKC